MNKIAVYIKKIHTQLERRRNYRYRDYDLTSTQLDIMEYLYFHTLPHLNSAGQPYSSNHSCDSNVFGGLEGTGGGQKNSLSGLAAFFGVQHTSVIHVLKILEKKELIYRKESPKDCRCKAILLTQKGRDIIHSHLGCPAGRNAFLYAGIPEKELEIMEKSLRQMYQNLLENQTDGFHASPHGKTIQEKEADEKTGL